VLEIKRGGNRVSTERESPQCGQKKGPSGESKFGEKQNSWKGSGKSVPAFQCCRKGGGKGDEE